MKIREIIPQVLSFGIGVIGFACLTAALGNNFEIEPLMAGIAFSSVGAFGFKHFRTKALKRIKKDYQLTLLQLFTNTGERFSLAEIALELNSSIEDTRELMDDLHTQGVLELSTTEHGALVYSLPQGSSYIQQNFGNNNTNGVW